MKLFPDIIESSANGSFYFFAFGLNQSKFAVLPKSLANKLSRAEIAS